MLIEFDQIAEFMGSLCGAARHDWVDASPEDVGMHGVPIKGWRHAYFEGCKDMAEGIAARLPEEYREKVKEIAQASFHKAFTDEQDRAASAAQTSA